jgi:hypothetical protein
MGSNVAWKGMRPWELCDNGGRNQAWGLYGLVQNVFGEGKLDPYSRIWMLDVGVSDNMNVLCNSICIDHHIS